MAGFGELFAGAAVGTLTSELYKRLENLIKKYREFNPVLEKIKATLDALEPITDQIEDKNKQLNLAPEEIEKLKTKIREGIKLLDECAADPKWYKKVSYTKKLTDFDESLKRPLGVLTAQGVRDGKETLLLVREQADHVVESTGFLKDNLQKLKHLKSVGYDILKLGLLILTVYVIIKVVARLAFVTKVVGKFVDESWSRYRSGSGGHLGNFVVVVITEILKFVSYLQFFFVGFRILVFSMTTILEEYRKGFSIKGLRKMVFMLATAVYFLYCCILVFMAVNCRC